MATYELVIDNAKMQIHCNDPEPPPPPYYNPLKLSTYSEPNGWDGGDDHLLLPWDDTMCVALFSDFGESQGSICSVHVASNGSLTKGPVTAFAQDVSYNTADGDHNSGGYYPSGNTSRGVKVGNKVIYWIRYATSSLPQDMYTFTYNESNDTWTQVAHDQPDFGYTQTSPYVGGVIAPVDDSTLLLVSHESSDDSGGSRMMFARWNGSNWGFGSIANSDTIMGSYDYQEAEPYGNTGQVIVTTGYYDDVPNYGIVSGSYPSAPSLHISSAQVGVVGYFEREFYARSITGDVVRILPLATGTTTPLTGGSDSFDWGAMPLTIEGGEVVEGEIVNVGSSDSYYDVAVGETTDGDTWVVHESSTEEDTYPYQGTLEIWRVGDDSPIGSLASSDDEGIRTNDYSIRTAAAVGNRFVIGWYTNGLYQFWVKSYPAED